MKKLIFLIQYCFALAWYSIFEFYYRGLMVQAQYLYRQSDLFRFRWQEIGLKFAEDTFEQEAWYFLQLAKKEPLEIKFKIFCNGLMGKEPIPYYLSDI